MSDETRIVPAEAQLPALVVEQEAQALDELALAFERESIAESTKRTYASRFGVFSAWCRARGYPDLPTTGQVLQRYATAAVTEGVTPRGAMNLRTLEVHLAAIQFVHRMMGHQLADLPTTYRKGLRRTLGAPPRKKQWMSLAQLREAVQSLPNNLKGARDKAILLVAFASGGRRRSEIASMRVEHLRAAPTGGFEWTLERSKTDQEGQGFLVAIPKLRNPSLCPTRALVDWLKRTGITAGHVFWPVDRHGNLQRREPLQPRAVADVVKAAAARLGLDPDEFGGHSLRSGFATDMARKGQRIEDIMARTGHRSLAVAQEYVRAGQLFADRDPVRQALDEED